jgi:hypothetical protein
VRDIKNEGGGREGRRRVKKDEGDRKREKICGGMKLLNSG